MRFVVMAFFVFFPLFAQEAREKTTNMDIPNPTNLKVLNVTTGAEISRVMRTFTAGLGVQCGHCHVEGNFASDANPKKETARQMIKLTQKINADFPDRQLHASCYTCHRGETKPRTAPAPKPGQ
jgi:photosynthetic reaction center cytochrome c subunit